MAEKKQHKIVSASTGEEVTEKKAAPKKAAPVDEAPAKEAPKKEIKAADPADNSNPKTLRILAWVFWVMAFVFEVLAFLIFSGKLEINFTSTTVALIGALVLDLAMVILGAQFWKKANHIDPISEAKKAKFWLWNNMGVIVCCFAFIPFLILALTNKDADPKLKKIAVIAAAAALLIGGAASYDWNPVSEEGLAVAQQTLAGQTVYWTQYGKKYHTHEDCQHLNRSDVLTAGTIDEAVAAGRSSMCKTCASRDNIEVGDNGAITAVAPVEQAAEELAPAA